MILTKGLHHAWQSWYRKSLGQRRQGEVKLSYFNLKHQNNTFLQISEKLATTADNATKNDSVSTHLAVKIITEL